MARLLNQLINLSKWPMALLMLLMLLPSLEQFKKVISYMFQHDNQYRPITYGALAYLLASWFILNKSRMGAWFSTLEHELTHALFAVLSLNRVTGLNVTSHAGGHMSYQGYPNWLITISPYFVPTLSLFILGLIWLAKTSYSPLLLGLLGASIVYHLQSTWRETHHQQTDLKQVGWTFCWLFLPGANVIMWLFILLALPNDGLSLNLLEKSWNTAMQHLQMLVSAWV